MPRPVDDKNYLPGLDGLRTIAVVAVLLYHLHIPGFQGGLLGVGVFFTLSGYLITSILLADWQEHGRIRLVNFWIRRIRRLLPAVILLLIAVLAATATIQAEKLVSRSWEALSALFYYNNWYEIFQEKSYFDLFAAPEPLGHVWSLAIEEQFYVIWPLVLSIVLLLVGKSRKAKYFGAGFCLILATISSVWGAYLLNPKIDLTRIYEGTDTRAAGLLIGAAQ